MWKASKRENHPLHKTWHLSFLYQRAKKWCLTNTEMKIGVLIFSLLLWFFVILNNRYTYTFSARLELRNVPEDRIIKTRVPSRIQANFSGKGIDLMYLLFSQRSGLRFLIDVGSIRLRTTSILLDEYFRRNEDYILYPRGLELKFEHIVWPESLRIELDMLKTTKLPIVPDLELEPAPGYVLLGEPVITPDSAEITGPISAVAIHDKILTEKLALKNLTKFVEVDLKLVTPEGDNIRIQPNKVRLHQTVDQLSERLLTNVPVKVLGTISGARIETVPASVSLTVTGSLSILKQLKPEDIIVTIDLNEWKSNQVYYIPNLTLPVGVISHSPLTPEKIEVRVIRERF